jgi:hypothetical protein
MGQLQISFGCGIEGTELSLPWPGVTVGLMSGVAGGGTTFGPGALTQALARRAIRTRTANSDAAMSGVLFMGICMRLHETGNNDCFNYENIRSYHIVQGSARVLGTRYSKKVYQSVCARSR